MLTFTVTQHIIPNPSTSLSSLNSSFVSLSISAVPDAVVVSTVFQGAAETQRPPLNLDFPLWNRAPQATLEDMELTCQRPTTVSTNALGNLVFRGRVFCEIF